MIKAQSVVNVSIHQYKDSEPELQEDMLCCEEPLEIRVPFINSAGTTDVKTLAITMRTPGNDRELITGFLYSEGIISSRQDITGFRYCDERGEAGSRNSLEVQLNVAIPADNQHLERRITTYSSCGLCGKTSIQNLELQNPPDLDEQNNVVDVKTVKQLSRVMLLEQKLFKQTGSAHASGLFDFSGKLLHLFEDVGRHNALDKLIGYYLEQDARQLSQSILLVSGRVSFELAQKAIMAGIPILAAVGAPSSLAVSTAKRFNLTMIGFLRDNSFNIYNASWRVKREKES